jgi:carboxypeptidase Taq
MPPGGAPNRAHVHTTVSSLIHDLLVSDDLAKLLDVDESSLDYDSLEASLIRRLRHDHEKEVRVPPELRAELAHAAAESFPIWVEARRTSNFELLRPYLERSVEARRRYSECFEVDEPYDALLDEFETGMKTAEVRAVFDRLKEALPPLIAEASAQGVDDSVLQGHFPIERQKELEQILLGRFGFAEGSWRLDTVQHPFAASLGTSDIRITTNYSESELDMSAAMHEAGHAVYEHNIDPALERTPLCIGASAALHESQSRLFENLVGRSHAFWRWGYPEVQRLFPEQFAGVELDDFVRALNKVQPSPIRIEADEATYSLHVVLRFELELDLLAGRVAVADLPRAWNERMQESLGIEIADDAHGVLQDPHWCAGFGYFPTYALGNVISVQLWEKVLEDVPDLDDHLDQGDLRPLCDSLRERVWRHGRKFTPRETLERAVGGGLDPEPYLRYLTGKLGAVAA